MLLPGLVSVTFRPLSPAEIVALARRAELRGIEWGGDLHVPHGQLARAREVRELTQQAGLEIAGYGSYYRAARSEDEGLAFERVLETAVELGAPVIRVWAGTAGSAAMDPAERRRVVDDLRRITALAATAGMRVALEYHGGTLNDAAAPARELLAAVSAPQLLSHWQPLLDVDDAGAAASLQTVLPHLAHLHVYEWRTVHDRRPLAEGEARWREFFRLAALAPGKHFAALEFVRDDSPAQFLEDAAALRRLLAGTAAPA